jgi:hypothetical protein
MKSVTSSSYCASFDQQVPKGGLMALAELLLPDALGEGQIATLLLLLEEADCQENAAGAAYQFLTITQVSDPPRCIRWPANRYKAAFGTLQDSPITYSQRNRALAALKRLDDCKYLPATHRLYR